jgi:hypothetical protein
VVAGYFYRNCNCFARPVNIARLVDIARLVNIAGPAGDWDLMSDDWPGADWDPPFDELNFAQRDLHSRSEPETGCRVLRAPDRGAARLTA